MTAFDLITRSLRLLGVVASDEQPTMSELSDALAVFQDMVDAWNADRLSIFTTSSQDFPFVIGQQAYTLGTGANFNMTRPAQIDSASVMVLTNPAVPVEIPLQMYTVDEWQTKVPVKSVQSSFPQVCYDDGGFPNRTLSFWPIPNQANNVRIYSWQPLSSPATLQTTIAFPPGYAEAFRYNLSVRLAPEYGAVLRPEVASIAVDSLAKVKALNQPLLTLQSDIVAGPAGYNYRADAFGLPY